MKENRGSKKYKKNILILIEFLFLFLFFAYFGGKWGGRRKDWFVLYMQHTDHHCIIFCLIRIGRKKTLILSVLGLLASSLAVAWADNFYLFCVLRFIVGFCCAGTFMSAFVLGE